MRRVALGLAIVAALGAGGWWLRSRAVARRPAQAVIPTVAVTRGRLSVTLPANGLLESAAETPVSTDVEGSIIELCENNSPVQAGQLLLRLDTKRLIDERDGLVRDLADAREALNKAQADANVQQAQAESEVRRAREAYDLAQATAQAERDKIAAQVRFAEGEAARAERELERAQRLAKLNYIPGVKLREAEKEYRAAQFALEQARLQQTEAEQRAQDQVREAQAALDLAQQQLQAARVNANLTIEHARLEILDKQRRLQLVNGKIERSQVLAPTAGLAVVATNTENWPERRPYRVGDTLRANRPVVTIYDPKQMRVRCQIGEMDMARVRQGQKAWVLSPSDPRRRYRAQVAATEQIAREANVWEGGTPGKKVFTVLVTLAEADPAHLRPGMSVDLEIVLQEIEDAVLVPLQAVFQEAGDSVVYRKQGDRFERVPVTLGARSDLSVQVLAGLREGERVALARPRLEEKKR